MSVMTALRHGSSRPALLSVPPYLLEGRNRMYVRGPEPVFHRGPFELAEPVAFPRELFADVLREHARLVDAHAAAVMAAPLDRPWFEVGNPEDRSRHVEISALPRSTSILAVEGSVVEIHRWKPTQASWVLQRCRGIVRKLMLRLPEDHTHLVVVAGGVASLHVMRGVPPVRAGEGERLEVVQRDVVVEPWDQWHRHRDEHVVTWWRTPAGELVASRVADPPDADDGPSIGEALLRIYRDELRAALASHEPEEPGGKPLVLLRSQRSGDEIEVMDRQWAEMTLEDYPTLLAAIGGAPAGFAPIVVDLSSHATLQWCPVGALDVATPPLVHAKDDSRDGPDPYDMKFDDPPPVALAEVPRWARRLEVGWWVVVVLALLAGLLVSLVAMIIGLALPEREEGAAALLEVVLPVTALLWVYLFGRVLQPSAPGAPPPRPRRRTRFTGRKFWMGRLARRLGQLEHLVDIGAPEPIIEDSRRIVRDAIAELAPADAEAVLRAWPRAAKMAETNRTTRTRPEDRPN
jgi:hypothetical protein